MGHFWDNIFVVDIRLGSKYASDYDQTQKQLPKDIVKTFKILICTLKIKVKLLMLTWKNARF